jgi:hypothetical protein
LPTEIQISTEPPMIRWLSYPGALMFGIAALILAVGSATGLRAWRMRHRPKLQRRIVILCASGVIALRI